jgi:transposase
MKKRRYRATNVKQANWEKIASLTAGQRIVFSVDVAKDDFFGALMTADRSVIDTIKWVHPQQTREVGEHLLHDLDGRNLEVVMEPSGTYGDALRGYLSGLGLAVYRVSPKRVHDAAEVYDGVPSLHDAKSAYLIGRVHLDGASAPWEELAELRRDHHALIAELDLYQGQHQANLNRLEASLNRHWPEVVRILDLSTVSLHTLIGEYGDPGQVSDHRDEAERLLLRTGRGPLSAEKIQQVLASSEASLGLPCTEGERHLLQVLGQELLRTHQAMKAIEHRIDKVVEDDLVLGRMANVVGKTTSLVLEATQGTPLDYANPHSYLKGLGLNLKERSSGKHAGQLKITKRGPGKARKYLYFTALRWSNKDPVIAAWYQKKVKRDGGLKGKAIIAVMRKLALSLWYVARGEAFDSRKLFNTRALGIAA